MLGNGEIFGGRIASPRARKVRDRFFRRGRFKSRPRDRSHKSLEAKRFFFCPLGGFSFGMFIPNLVPDLTNIGHY
jgi:hypothetical protein